MEKLSFKNRILIGLTLFSMFFGAGNLIFPPHLGAQAGGNVGPALMGFVLSAIGIPVLGVAAVALSDGLENLAQKVHPVFASAFTVLLYLSIGPFLAIPRTAGTSYEMAVAPFLKNGGHSRLFLCVYSVGFFMIAVFLALKPDKLTDRLGKILGPLLLILIGVVFIGCWLNSGAGEGAVVGDYADHPVSRGFLDGYQTMDTIAALNFGIIIAMNIRKKGVKKERGIVRETIFSGIVAGILLLAVYSALAWVGAAAGARFGAAENGARTLSQMMVLAGAAPGLFNTALNKVVISALWLDDMEIVLALCRVNIRVAGIVFFLSFVVGFQRPCRVALVLCKSQDCVLRQSINPPSCGRFGGGFRDGAYKHTAPPRTAP